MPASPRILAACSAVALSALWGIAGVTPGSVPVQRAVLTSAGAAAGEYLGNSVAISGGTIVAGAFGTDSDRGSALVFRRAGPAWEQEKLFYYWTSQSGDRLGWSVAASGDTVLLGIRGEDGSRGAARILARDGSSWDDGTRLVAPDPRADALFGYAVALQGDTAVVTAMWESQRRGAVYVFERAGGTWTLQAELAPADLAVDDWFGASVALSDDTLLVGAMGKDGFRGAAYVFTRNGAVWTEQAKLEASDGATSDNFGYAVAFQGETAVVGANTKDALKGAAYVFRRSGADWLQEAKLTAPDAADDDEFGCSVAVSGDTALVGAFGHDARRGQVYRFVRSGADWAQKDAFGASDPSPNDSFGVSMALAGDTLVVGAYGKNSYRGAAYVFTGVLPPSGYCLPAKVKAKPNAAHPERSSLTLSGVIDTGAGDPDFSGAATFDVGGFRLDVPAFVAKGRSLTYAAGGISLTIAPAKTGSSRAAFSAKVVGDLAGKVDLDGPLDLRFVNAAHDLRGSADLTAGALGPHCVTSPKLCVLAASATVKGGGKDSLRLTFGFATDGAVPPAAEDLTIGFGDSFTSELLRGDYFRRRRNAWVLSAKPPGITNVTVDHAKGTITVAGSGLDLGSFLDGANEVSLTVTRGGEARTARVRMALRGTKLTY